MQFHRVPTNVLKFLSWTYIIIYKTQMFRQTCDSNNSVQQRHIFVQTTFKTRKRNTGFYVLRQGVPEGDSSEGYASLNKSSLGLGT